MHLETVPKAGGGDRTLTRLDPRAATHYAALVAPVVARLEGALGPEVVANRVRGRGARTTTTLEPWRGARSIWRREVVTASRQRTARTLVVSDVTRCYESLDAAVVARRMHEVGAGATAVALERFLGAVAERGTRGLPVGPDPSAILANVALATVDRRIRDAGVRHLRWVDDVVMVCEGRRDAVRAFDAFRRGLDEIGLRPNLSKTLVLTDPAAIRARLLLGGAVSPCDDAAP